MTDILNYADPSDIIFEFPCIKLRQPVGELFVGALPYKILCAIADFDVRHVLQEERDLDRYLGIQRPLKLKRVREIQDYVNFADAAFPTAIIIAVDPRCALFDSASSTMTLRNIRDQGDPVLARRIARVIDGQHRIAGLYQCRQENFDLPVTILVGSDIADQAQMFARVNLSQTPVNPSLVYDLFELAKSKSPQKFTHEITVKMDRMPDGPFQRRIKRLGTATPNRDREYLTQATVVKGMLQLITDNADVDRDFYLRNQVPPRASRKDIHRLIFRNSFLDDREDIVLEAITNLFLAVRERWPVAWEGAGEGYILPRTNGYLALMRYLRDATVYFVGSDRAVSVEMHLRLLRRVELEDHDLTSERFLPGTGGEAALYRELSSVIPA